MARLAGLPACQVTGYIGGTWTGDGYAVYSNDVSTCPRFAFSKTVPTVTPTLVDSLDPCPPAEEVEIVNQTISTMTVAHDGTETITVSGQLRYVANGTPVQDIRVLSYLTPVADAEFVPGPGAALERLRREHDRTQTGRLRPQVSPTPLLPWMHNIGLNIVNPVMLNDGVIFDGFVNLTDNATLNHTAPQAINAPIAGAGATTVLEGRLVLANQPVDEILNMPNQTVWLSYTFGRRCPEFLDADRCEWRGASHST